MAGDFSVLSFVGVRYSHVRLRRQPSKKSGFSLDTSTAPFQHHVRYHFVPLRAHHHFAFPYFASTTFAALKITSSLYFPVNFPVILVTNGIWTLATFASEFGFELQAACCSGVRRSFSVMVTTLLPVMSRVVFWRLPQPNENKVSFGVLER